MVCVCKLDLRLPRSESLILIILVGFLGCAGGCDFQYDSDRTPLLSAASVDSKGEAEWRVSLDGAGFDLSPSLNRVYVGSTPASCDSGTVSEDAVFCRRRRRRNQLATRWRLPVRAA